MNVFHEQICEKSIVDMTVTIERQIPEISDMDNPCDYNYFLLRFVWHHLKKRAYSDGLLVLFLVFVNERLKLLLFDKLTLT